MHKTTLGWLTLLLAMVVLGLAVLPVWAWPAAATPAGPTSPAMALTPPDGSRPRPGLSASHEMTLQPGEGDTTTLRDAQIRDDTPDANDANGALQVRAYGPEQRSLLLWKLPEALDGATIESARLELYFYYRSKETEQEIALYEVLLDWDEAAVTWRQRTAGATWNTAGCSAAGLDRASAPVFTCLIAATDPKGTWHAWDVTPLVAKWAQQPGANHGLILVSTG
ncbi:MAG: DNRLRE domain-containing protein, partial [Chloroflexota bacterium]